MTRKDYRVIAGAFRKAYADCKIDEERYGVTVARLEITYVLQVDNPHSFDEQKFTQAATPERQVDNKARV